MMNRRFRSSIESINIVIDRINPTAAQSPAVFLAWASPAKAELPIAPPPQVTLRPKTIAAIPYTAKARNTPRVAALRSSPAPMMQPIRAVITNCSP